MRSFQNGFVLEPHFSIGDVLSRTFSTLLHKPGFFFGLAAIAALPSAVVNSAAFFGSTAAAFIPAFLNLMLSLMIQGAIAYGVFMSLAGDDPTWGEAVSRGFRRILYLFLIALIMWLLFVLLTVVTTMLIVFMRSLAAGVVIVLLMLVIAAVMICSWTVTIQACVVEQLGPIASLNRSAELTKGYRWHIFALFALIFIIAIVLIVIVSMVASLVFSSSLILQPMAETAALFIASLLSAAFVGVMCSVIYYDLRAVKEGLTIDSLADIFD